jgi:hypothetical protein
MNDTDEIDNDSVQREAFDVIREYFESVERVGDTCCRVTFPTARNSSSP